MPNIAVDLLQVICVAELGDDVAVFTVSLLFTVVEKLTVVFNLS